MNAKAKTPALPGRTACAKISRLALRLREWFAANARDLPWRRTRDPYAIWVSEIMLQQTQVKTVIPFWNRWLRELPTMESAAKAPSDKIHKLWEGLGYYTRVRNLQKAAQVIVEKHGGKFPKNFEDVLALPGHPRSHQNFWHRQKPEREANERAALATGGRTGSEFQIKN